VLILAAPAEASDLLPATNAAFDKYVQLTETRMAGEIDGRAAFLWIDREPESRRRDVYDRLQRGEIVVSRLDTRERGAAGFLWRFNNYCSLDERETGTYVQCESISLSRAIHTGLGWLVGPFVKSIPRDSLEFTLGAIRTAARPAQR